MTFQKTCIPLGTSYIGVPCIVIIWDYTENIEYWLYTLNMNGEKSVLQYMHL